MDIVGAQDSHCRCCGSTSFDVQELLLVPRSLSLHRHPVPLCGYAERKQLNSRANSGKTGVISLVFFGFATENWSTRVTLFR